MTTGNSNRDLENKIKVSVILPVYNVDEYLKECLDSVVNQTLNDIEIICINDGSTDSSLAILNEYAQKDDRFVVLSQENQGQGVARNNGIELAKGKYIQFVDPDDWIELNMLETLYNFAEEHNSQVVKFDYKEYNQFSGVYKKIDFIKSIKKRYNYNLLKIPYYNWRILKKGCLMNLELHVWTHFYLTQYIKTNNIQFAPTRIGEDHLFADGAILLASQIDYLNKFLYIYRQREGSAVHIKSDINFDIFEDVSLLKDFIISHNLYSELKEEFNEYAKKIISHNYHKVPNESLHNYEQMSKNYFKNNKEFKKYCSKRTLMEKIFSLKNEYDGAVKLKAVTILGFTFHIKPKKQSLANSNNL